MARYPIYIFLPISLLRVAPCFYNFAPADDYDRLLFDAKFPLCLIVVVGTFKRDFKSRSLMYVHGFRWCHDKDIESNRWYREQWGEKRICRVAPRCIASRPPFTPSACLQPAEQSRLVGRGRKERYIGWSLKLGGSSTFRCILMMTRSLRHVVIATSPSSSSSLDHARPEGNWNFDLQLGRQTNDTGWPYSTLSLPLSSIRLAAA